MTLMLCLLVGIATAHLVHVPALAPAPQRWAASGGASSGGAAVVARQERQPRQPGLGAQQAHVLVGARERTAELRAERELGAELEGARGQRIDAPVDAAGALDPLAHGRGAASERAP